MNSINEILELPVDTEKKNGWETIDKRVAWCENGEHKFVYLFTDGTRTEVKKEAESE